MKKTSAKMRRKAAMRVDGRYVSEKTKRNLANLCGKFMLCYGSPVHWRTGATMCISI